MQAKQAESERELAKSKVQHQSMKALHTHLHDEYEQLAQCQAATEAKLVAAEAEAREHGKVELEQTESKLRAEYTRIVDAKTDEMSKVVEMHKLEIEKLQSAQQQELAQLRQELQVCMEQRISQRVELVEQEMAVERAEFRRLIESQKRELKQAEEQLDQRRKEIEERAQEHTRLAIESHTQEMDRRCKHLMETHATALRAEREAHAVELAAAQAAYRSEAESGTGLSESSNTVCKHD